MLQQKMFYMWLKRVLAIIEIDLALATIVAFVEVFHTKNLESILWIGGTVILGLLTVLSRELVKMARHKEETTTLGGTP